MALISIYTHFKAPTLSSSSTIIQEVACLNEARSALMACFHFDFRDLDKQHRRDLPPFLLVQLSSQSRFCCVIFPPLYSACHNGAQKPNDEVCLKDMLAITGLQPIYIIMDALDECPTGLESHLLVSKSFRSSRSSLTFIFRIFIFASQPTRVRYPSYSYTIGASLCVPARRKRFHDE